MTLRDDDHEWDDDNDNEQPRSGGGAPAPAPPATVTDEMVTRVVEALRRLGDGQSIEKIQDEVNTTEGDRLALGQVDAVLRELLARGLADRKGEMWSPVRPGTLAFRRGDLLAKASVEALEGGAYFVPASELADARALHSAGLAAFEPRAEDGDTSKDVGTLTARKDDAVNLIGRGAIQAVADVMPECRAPSTGLTLTIAPGTDDETKAAIEKLEAEIAKAVAEKEAAQQQRAEVIGQRERLRAYLRARDVDPLLVESPPSATPTASAHADVVEGEPVASAPPGARRATWSKEVVIDQAERSRMLDESVTLARRLTDIRRDQNAAKEANAARMAAFKETFNATLDASERLERELQAGKRVVDREAFVVVDWKLDVEIWTDAKTGEELERRAIPKGTQRTLPADLPPKPKAGESPFAAAETPPALPAAPPPLPDKDNVQAALVEVVNALDADELIALGVATERLAKARGWEANTKLGQLVQKAARTAHKAALIHWEATEGGEKVGRVRAKQKGKGAVAATASAPAPTHEQRVLDALANGPRSKVEIQTEAKLTTDLLEKLLKELIAAGKVETIGKARGTKYQLAGGSAS